MLKSALESILFISNRPLTIGELIRLTGKKGSEVEAALKELMDRYQQEKVGMTIIKTGSKFQMVTHPDNFPLVQKFLEKEVNRELTPAALETLSIVAYRGPIRREELDQIRGINCSIILRHLLIKGLVEEKQEGEEIVYQVSIDFLRRLGINQVEDLPDWDKLNKGVPLESFVQPEGQQKLEELTEPEEKEEAKQPEQEKEE